MLEEGCHRSHGKDARPSQRKRFASRFQFNKQNSKHWHTVQDIKETVTEKNKSSKKKKETVGINISGEWKLSAEFSSYRSILTVIYTYSDGRKRCNDKDGSGLCQQKMSFAIRQITIEKHTQIVIGTEVQPSQNV